MKPLLLTFLLFISGLTYSQEYQLSPDSCTFCFFNYSQGTSSWEDNFYVLDPFDDTLISGITYNKIYDQWGMIGPWNQIGYREVNNKLYIIYQDDPTEYLAMDFNASVGDTIYNLNSEGIFYNTRVVNKDSIAVNADFHHFMILEGILYYNSSSDEWIEDHWEIKWEERGLCNYYGGVLFNVPFGYYNISATYYNPIPCTTDPRYDISPNVSCENCIPQREDASILEYDEQSFSIHPNPLESSNNLTITLKEIGGMDHSIVLKDQTGKIIYRSKLKNNKLQIPFQLKQGIYFISVGDDYNRITTQKLIVL